jgi:phosphatidylglycerophosphate synthase
MSATSGALRAKGGPLTGTLRRLSGAQKGATGAPPYSRFVNRPLGRLLAALAFQAGLTPNALTGISAAWTASGIALIALGEPSWPLAMAVTGCLLLGYGFDAADGQLARLRGGGSPAGEWLDHMVDAAKLPALHLAVLISFYRFDTVAPALLLVPLGFCVIDTVHFFATLLNEGLRQRHGVPTRSQPTGRRSSVIRSLRNLPTDYGVLGLLFVLFGTPWLFVPAYTVLFAAAVGYLALASVKWFREMGRMPR